MDSSFIRRHTFPKIKLVSKYLFLFFLVSIKKHNFNYFLMLISVIYKKLKLKASQNLRISLTFLFHAYNRSGSTCPGLLQNSVRQEKGSRNILLQTLSLFLILSSVDRNLIEEKNLGKTVCTFVCL